MLKQFISIFSFMILLSSFILAQEEPKEEKEETKTEVEVKTEETTEVKEETVSKEIWNKVCPIEGGRVDKDSPTVEYKGKLYGFCCAGCDSEFSENPVKYAKYLNEEGTRFIGRK